MAASLIPDPVISTTSTCAPERTRGEHVFKIEGYSVCKGFGVGKFIRSATFSVGGHDWCVRYYPDGVTEAYRDYVSVYLELMNRDVEVLALCHLTLVQQATGSPAQFASPKLMAPVLLSSSIGSITWSWGYATFATRSDLEASSHWYIPDDVLLIKCELTVIKPKKVEGMLRKMNLSEAEKKGVKVGWRRSMQKQKEDADLKAMGKLMSDKPGYTGGMEVVLGKAWCPMKRLEVKDMGENRFLFVFQEEMGRRKAVENGP
uniref:Uncharacterized protein n=1 Tax=Aegilops tauschii TaxID=37682 RepID=M8C6Z8_AEGTA